MMNDAAREKMRETPVLLLLLLLLLPVACLDTSATNDLIDGKRLMEHVEAVVSHGPHPPGSEAQRRVGDYIIQELESYGLEVQTHSFRPVTPLGRLEMRNIWGIIPGSRDSVILLAGHYDSKHFEEFEFVGANDGGSSTALLLELARLLAEENPTEHTLWITFFDGEEALLEWTNADSLYGSREMVRLLKRRGQLNRIRALILLDMIGGKDLSLRRDTNSTAWLNELIWKKADELGYGNVFLPRGVISVVDDHIPFAEEGIPVVDLIDMDYRYWHRPEDTPDKLSAESMQIVGRVVLASLPEIGGRVAE